MKKQKPNNDPVFSQTTLRIAIALALFLAATSLTMAQDPTTPSTDRDNPTPFTSNVVTGDGVDDKTEYFYSFNAGPGEVTITLDVKAEKDRAVSSVDIALFDAKSKKLMSTYANPDHGSSKRVVETVKVRGTQTLLLEVAVSQGVDTFKIKLDGAVKFDPTVGGSVAPADPSATPSPSPSEASAALDSSSSMQTDATAADSTSGVTAAGTEPGSGATPATAQEAGTAQHGAAGNSSKTSKVNSKINSGSSTLSGIITAAGSMADSAKSLKKKKQ
jgi:hypothetical protein